MNLENFAKELMGPKNSFPKAINKTMNMDAYQYLLRVNVCVCLLFSWMSHL